jgi:hypothetical protein
LAARFFATGFRIGFFFALDFTAARAIFNPSLISRQSSNQFELRNLEQNQGICLLYRLQNGGFA